jgi:hypothetical protein
VPLLVLAGALVGGAVVGAVGLAGADCVADMLVLGVGGAAEP